MSYLMASELKRAPRRTIAAEALMLVLMLCCLMQGTATVCDDNIPSRPVPGDLEQTSRDQMCQAGQYLVGTACEPCELKTFMTSNMAANRVKKCLPCLQPGQAERVIVECNATRDTEISCKDDFYRTQSSESCSWQCNQCSICGVGLNLYNDYEIRRCNGMYDTLCCHEDDMVEVDGICSPTTSTSLTPSPHTSPVAYTTTGTSHSSGNSATRTACLLSYHYIMSITMSLYNCKR